MVYTIYDEICTMTKGKAVKIPLLLLALAFVVFSSVLNFKSLSLHSFKFNHSSKVISKSIATLCSLPDLDKLPWWNTLTAIEEEFEEEEDRPGKRSMLRYIYVGLLQNNFFLKDLLNHGDYIAFIGGKSTPTPLHIKNCVYLI